MMTNLLLFKFGSTLAARGAFSSLSFEFMITMIFIEFTPQGVGWRHCYIVVAKTQVASVTSVYSYLIGKTW